MSEPIKAGDLVVVVKPTPCCGNEKAVGLHFVVQDLLQAFGRYHCAHCDRTYPNDVVALSEKWPVAYQLWRLKRIPPLSELESEKRREEIEA